MQQPTTTQDQQEVVEDSLATTREPQNRRRPAWMSDYEVTGIDQSKDPLVHFALFADCDPVTFEKAVKKLKWRRAMDEELAAIERNNT